MSGTPSSGAHNPTARRLLASRAATSSSTLAQQPPSQPVTSRAAAALRNINTAPEDLDNNEVRILDIPNYISGSGGFYDWLDRDLVAGASGRKYRFAPELSKSGQRLVFVENSESGHLEAVPASEVGAAAGASAAGSGPGRALDVDIDNDGDTAGDDETTRLLREIDGRYPGEDSPLYGWPSRVQDHPDVAQDVGIEQTLTQGSLGLMLRCAYLCAQGVLAGFCFVSVYSLTTYRDDEDLIINYQSVANESRRFFYILSTLSLVGALDACLDMLAPSTSSPLSLVDGDMGRALLAASSGGGSTEGRKGKQVAASRFLASTANVGGVSEASNSKIVSSSAGGVYRGNCFLSGCGGEDPGQKGSALQIAAVLLYLLSLLLTLIMSSQDVLIGERNGMVDGPDWAADALQDNSFSSGLDNWKKLAMVRLICSIVAWFICCALVWSDLTLSLRLVDLVVRLRRMVLRRQRRIGELEGDGDALTDMPEMKLRHLIGTLRLGLTRAQDALRSRSLPRHGSQGEGER